MCQGRCQEDLPGLQAAAQTGGLPALRTWAAQRGSAGVNTDMSSTTAAGQQQGLLAGARGAYSLQRVHDCVGLPVPTGSGATVQLGSRQCATSVHRDKHALEFR